MHDEADFPLIRELEERTGQKPAPAPRSQAAPPPARVGGSSRPATSKPRVMNYLDWTAQEKARKLKAKEDRAKRLAHPFTVDDRIIHEAFGEGTVQDVDTNGLVVILFDTGDTRRLMGSMAPMRKVN